MSESLTPRTDEHFKRNRTATNSTRRFCNNLETELSAALNRLQEAELDAARYRWLRDNPEDAPIFEEGSWEAIYLNPGAGDEAGVSQAYFDTLTEAVDFLMSGCQL